GGPRCPTTAGPAGRAAAPTPRGPPARRPARLRDAARSHRLWLRPLHQSVPRQPFSLGYTELPAGGGGRKLLSIPNPVISHRKRPGCPRYGTPSAPRQPELTYP